MIHEEFPINNQDLSVQHLQNMWFKALWISESSSRSSLGICYIAAGALCCLRCCKMAQFFPWETVGNFGNGWNDVGELQENTVGSVMCLAMFGWIGFIFLDHFDGGILGRSNEHDTFQQARRLASRYFLCFFIVDFKLAFFLSRFFIEAIQCSSRFATRCRALGRIAMVTSPSSLPGGWGVAFFMASLSFCTVGLSRRGFRS